MFEVRNHLSQEGNPFDTFLLKIKALGFGISSVPDLICGFAAAQRLLILSPSKLYSNAKPRD
jgi:hypothetical protein